MIQKMRFLPWQINIGRWGFSSHYPFAQGEQSEPRTAENARTAGASGAAKRARPAVMSRTPRVPRRYAAPRCAQELARVGSLPRDAGRALVSDRRSSMRSRRDLTDYCAPREQTFRITRRGETGQTASWLRGPARLVRDRPGPQNVFWSIIL